MQEIRKFLFIDEHNIEHSILEYNPNTDKYLLHLREDLTFEQSTCFESMFIAKGIYDLDEYWSRRFVQSRVIPPNRQNIATLMKSLGITEYSEFPFLLACNGKCADDRMHMIEVTHTDLTSHFN